MKHIKKCLDCNTELTKNTWYSSRKIRNEKMCIDCYALFNKARMTINNKRMNMGNPQHPFHNIYITQGKFATYKAMGITTSNTKLEFIKKETLALYDQVNEGEVYIISNPAWKGWLKIGMAINAEDRCKGYQTSSPLRDYKIEYRKEFKDRRSAESTAHRRLKRICKDFAGEWFYININKVKEVIESI